MTQFVGWMYDIAREQAPSADLLLDMLHRSGRAGYTGVGLYVEHRFAYPSARWAATPGCLTPEAVRHLSTVVGASGPRVIPFLNTLGHMEGFIRSEGGRWLGEGPGEGSLQMCPSRPECVEFAWRLVCDAMEAFSDEWIHLGGDETKQLGACALCAERVRAIGEAGLYADYFGQLCRRVLERGRRPCLWGDMLVRYPEALASIPSDTVIFDWCYDASPAETTRMFRERGFDVVCCPALRTYDSGWCFLDESWRLVDMHAENARRLGALGVLLCAWEFFGFSSFGSALPLILAAGRRLSRRENWTTATECEGGPGYVQAAEMLGREVIAASQFLRPGAWRSLREQLVLQGDPFALWRGWREDACGAAGDVILRACDQAEVLLPPDSPMHFPIELHRVAVEWVRLVEEAQWQYASRDAVGCASALARGRAALGRLGPGLEGIATQGGSAADLQRLGQLLDAVDRVSSRLHQLPRSDSSWPVFAALVRGADAPADRPGYRPAGPA